MENSTADSRVLTHTLPFGIFTALIIPSVPCYIFIFVQYIRKDIFRQNIRSHTLLLVLICSALQVMTEMPTILTYLFNGVSPNESKSFCRFWAFQDYSFNVMILMLMALLAVERYLLVFHHLFLNRHLILLHYGPMAFCVVYPILLYAYFVFLYPCDPQFDYTMMTCGGPCYFYEPAVSTFDQFVNLVFPVFVSSTASLFLLVRVIRQKQHMQQHQIWRKNRRVVLQLLYIVILHNLVWLPMVTCSTIMLFSPTAQPVLVELSINILPYGIYVVILLCPFVSLMSLPELWPNFAQRIRPFLTTQQSKPLATKHSTVHGQSRHH